MACNKLIVILPQQVTMQTFCQSLAKRILIVKHRHCMGKWLITGHILNCSHQKHWQGALLRNLSPELLPSAAATHGFGLQHDGNEESGLDHREDLRGAQARKCGPAYTAVMTDMYNKVTELSLPNYLGLGYSFHPTCIFLSERP